MLPRIYGSSTPKLPSARRSQCSMTNHLYSHGLLPFVVLLLVSGFEASSIEAFPNNGVTVAMYHRITNHQPDMVPLHVDPVKQPLQASACSEMMSIVQHLSNHRVQHRKSFELWSKSLRAAASRPGFSCRTTLEPWNLCLTGMVLQKQH